MLVFISLFIAAAVIAIDQLLKIIVEMTVQTVPEGIPVIDGLLTWLYRENTGAAFSMFSNERWVFLVSSTILLFFCVYLLIRYFRNNPYGCFSIGLVMGGGIANMIDRVLQGYVVDYIHVSFFPAVFNFADCCVCVGAVLLVFPLLMDVWADEKTKAKKTASEDGAQSNPDKDAVSTDDPASGRESDRV